MGKKRSDAEWCEIIQACRASGLSDNHWCKMNHIATSTFYKHAKRWRDRASECILPAKASAVPVIQELVRIPLDESLAMERSAPVVVNESPMEMQPAVRLIHHGIHLEINNHATAEILAAALQMARQLC